MEATMTLYDYAKQVISQETPMDSVTRNHKYLEIAEWMLTQDSKYFMLLCNDRKDYTIFSITKNDPIRINIEFSKCIDPRGILLLCDKQPDGKYEIWIRDRETNENFVYYLFEASNFVVEV